MAAIAGQILVRLPRQLQRHAVLFRSEAHIAHHQHLIALIVGSGVIIDAVAPVAVAHGNGIYDGGQADEAQNAKRRLPEQYSGVGLGKQQLLREPAITGNDALRRARGEELRTIRVQHVHIAVHFKALLTLFKYRGTIIPLTRRM